MFSIKKRGEDGRIKGFVQVSEDILYELPYFNHWLFGGLRKSRGRKILNQIMKLK